MHYIHIGMRVAVSINTWRKTTNICVRIPWNIAMCNICVVMHSHTHSHIYIYIFRYMYVINYACFCVCQQGRGPQGLTTQCLLGWKYVFTQKAMWREIAICVACARGNHHAHIYIYMYIICYKQNSIRGGKLAPTPYKPTVDHQCSELCRAFTYVMIVYHLCEFRPLTSYCLVKLSWTGQFFCRLWTFSWQASHARNGRARAWKRTHTIPELRSFSACWHGRSMPSRPAGS